MTGNKPIIFLYPLSSSLKKYFDLVQENHEEEGIDIYEVDILGEAAQLIPTLGPSVILASSPKKCAQMLQQNSKSLKQQSSKVLLLSEKELPQKIIHKLQKFGLTEYLKEPINPKSLIYKVNLLLKSLPAITASEEKQEEQVFTSDGEAVQDTDQKQRVEKGILMEEESEDNEHSEHEEVTLNLTSTPKEKSEEVDLFDLGDDLKKELAAPIEIEVEDEDIAEENESPKEVDHIDTYYKSEQADKVELELSDSPSPKEDKPKNEDEILGDKVHRLNDSDLSMQFERPKIEEITIDEDEVSSLAAKERGSDTSFDLEAAKKELKREEIELSLKKGTVENADSEEDEQGSLENELIKHQEELLLDMSKEKKVAKDDVELVLTKEKEEINQNKDDELSDLYNVEESERLKLESTDETVKKEKKSLELEAESSVSEEEDPTEVADETPVKVKKAQTTFDLESSEDKSEENQDTDEDLYGTGKSDDKLDIEGKKLEKKKSKELELTQESYEDDEKVKKEDESSSVLSDSEKLKVEGDDKGDEDHSNLDLESGKKRPKRGSELDLTDGKSKKQSGEYDEAADSKKKITSDDTTLQIDAAKKKKLKDLELKAGETKKLDNLVDGVDYDWDTTKKERKDEDFGPWISKRPKSIEINFDKKDKSEETIDYRQLKKQFDKASLLERERGGRAGTGIEQSGYSKEDGKERVNGQLGDDEDIKIKVEKEEEEEEDVKDVFEPDSRGLEFMVKTLQMYLDGRNDKQIYLYLANTIYKEFHGIVGFFINDKTLGTAEEAYSGAHYIEYTENRDVLIASWEETKKKNRSEWSNVRLPYWQDEKFQADNNQFVYPFFEGIDHIGFVAVEFPTGITQSDSSKIEMTLEGVRAIYLEKQREGGIQGSYKQETDAKPAKEKQGLLGKFFGKKK